MLKKFNFSFIDKNGNKISEMSKQVLTYKKALKLAHEMLINCPIINVKKIIVIKI